MSRKTAKSRQDGRGACQKRVRNGDVRAADGLNVERLKINLSQMVNRLNVGGKVQAYEQIAQRLSDLAGLDQDRAWSWRYIASIHSGTIEPSEKFIRAFGLHKEHFNRQIKQWFYFARRRCVAAIYDRSILREIIFEHMRNMGYKPVTYTRYAQLRKRRS